MLGRSFSCYLVFRYAHVAGASARAWLDYLTGALGLGVTRSSGWRFAALLAWYGILTVLFSNGTACNAAIPLGHVRSGPFDERYWVSSVPEGYNLMLQRQPLTPWDSSTELTVCSFISIEEIW